MPTYIQDISVWHCEWRHLSIVCMFQLVSFSSGPHSCCEQTERRVVKILYIYTHMCAYATVVYPTTFAACKLRATFPATIATEATCTHAHLATSAIRYFCFSCALNIPLHHRNCCCYVVFCLLHNNNNGVDVVATADLGALARLRLHTYLSTFSVSILWRCVFSLSIFVSVTALASRCGCRKFNRHNNGAFVGASASFSALPQYFLTAYFHG